MSGGLPGRGLSKDEQDASKSLRAATFTPDIHTLPVIEMTIFSTNIDYPFLNDRILRLWNPIVSSARAAITTQPLKGRESLCLSL